MRRILQYIWRTTLPISVMIMLIGICGCSQDMESDDFFVKGKILELDVSVQGEQGGTRAESTSPLSTSETLYVTADDGAHWCKYTYDGSGLWKPASGETPISWTTTSMTLFAFVRHDGGTTGTSLTIKSDQSNKTNFDASDFLGSRETYSYSSGKVKLVLSHRVAKLTVIARNSPGTDLTCTTTEALPTSGVYELGYSNVDISSSADSPTSTIQLYQENYDAVNKIAYFSAYVFPKVGLKTNLTFTSGGKTATTKVSYNLPDFGVALDEGCITRYDVTLPNRP